MGLCNLEDTMDKSPYVCCLVVYGRWLTPTARAMLTLLKSSAF